MIIPLNTADDNVFDFQQNLIEFCIEKLFSLLNYIFVFYLGQRLYPTKEIIICTIYDYIASEESNLDGSNVSNDSSFLFRHQQRKIVCDFMREFAPIRIYLVGNETHIPNYWSRLSVARELDNGQNNIFEYTERCTFMENEPVKPEIKRNLPGFLGCKWQVTKTTPIRLDEIEKDENFHFALQYVYDTLEIRERETNIDLCQNGINYRENSADYSTAVGEKETEEKFFLNVFILCF